QIRTRWSHGVPHCPEPVVSRGILFTCHTTWQGPEWSGARLAGNLLHLPREGQGSNGDCASVAAHYPAGISTTHCVPEPGWLVISTDPPCATTIDWTMLNPNPAPPSARLRALSTR